MEREARIVKEKHAVHVVALSLGIFVLGLVSAQVSAFPNRIDRQLALVTGINAAVAPNPINTLADQLSQKEQTLTEREQALQQQESSLRTMLQDEMAKERQTLLWEVSVAIGVLLVLIGINYYLDFLRRNGEEGSSRHGELQTRL